ncbi:hypothetical protein C0J52_22971 [Blattella germanica]|nr:hypothetical protein C0J52_22971 [Blattella germanica]
MVWIISKECNPQDRLYSLVLLTYELSFEHDSINQHYPEVGHGQVSGPYFFEGALNGNMYADFLENIQNQPKRYESLTVLKEEYQFVWNDFSEEYIPTDRKHTYYPSVIINEHLYELKISDIPVIPYFPVNSYYEWTDYRFYGLRSATAYVLVFDLSNADTFQYIRTLRDQMLESRDMRNVPLLVVGNKQDLLVSSSATGGSAGGNGGAGSSGASGSGGATVAIAGSSSGGTSGKDVEYREKRRDIVNLVKKHWKCTYIECSAKYNWRVVAVFKELMKAVDSLEAGQTNKEVCSPMIDNIHDALDRNKCIIL